MISRGSGERARRQGNRVYFRVLYRSLSTGEFREPDYARRAHLPRPDSRPAELLGRAGLRGAAALRHGSGRRHLPHRDFPPRHRPGDLERRLRPAEPPSHRRPLWREPQPPAALLPVPGGPQAKPGELPGTLPRLAESHRHRPAGPRHPLRRRQLGIADPRRLGPGLGNLAERHGSHPVSPTSSRSAASSATPSPARSPTAWSAWPCTCRVWTRSTT
ncbi:Uncharacterised protein [Pseudomonas aeruginosa]|nr:Uncharacterised protein [Pseudomonas aeruginosa]